MSDQHAPSEPVASTPTPSRRPGLVGILPFVLTAVVAVTLSLGVQALLWPRPISPVAPAPSPTATRQPAPTATLVTAPPLTGTVRPSPSPAADAVLRLTVLDLEEQDRQLWSALYLLRASLQIDDAVAALQINDLDEADRTMLAAYRSLDRAYAFSAEQEKGPIDTFRLQLSQIRDDLRLRPEALDRRLIQLRRLILSLVDEGG